MYAAKFEIPWTNNILTFKTDHERHIEIGREYQEKPIEFGQCYITKNNELQATEGEIAFVKAPMTHLLN